MDTIESIAKRYLESLNLGTVIYEPDGNVPPDFLIDGRIAVEVTRLNQNYQDENGFTGLENNATAFWRMFQTLLPTFGPSREGMGWWVFYNFHRPLDMKAVKTALPTLLKQLCDHPFEEDLEIEVTKNFSINLRQATIPTGNLFNLAGYGDRDSGGWVLAEVIRNYKLCVPRKELKVLKVRDRYPIWWLVLVDLISSPFVEDEHERVLQHLPKSSFDRVILLNPKKPLLGLDMQ